MKKLILAALCGLALSSCTMSDKTVLENDIQTFKAGAAYSAGCLTAIEMTQPQVVSNPEGLAEVTQYCGEEGAHYTSYLRNFIPTGVSFEQSYTVGCMRNAIDSAGPPKNENEKNLLLSGCAEKRDEVLKRLNSNQ